MAGRGRIRRLTEEPEQVFQVLAPGPTGGCK